MRIEIDGWIVVVLGLFLLLPLVLRLWPSRPLEPPSRPGRILAMWNDVVAAQERASAPFAGTVAASVNGFLESGSDPGLSQTQKAEVRRALRRLADDMEDDSEDDDAELDRIEKLLKAL